VTPDIDAAMGRALELAAAAQEWGDTPIGAVVLGPDGSLLAEAANARESAVTRPRTPRCSLSVPRRGCTATAGG